MNTVFLLVILFFLCLVLFMINNARMISVSFLTSLSFLTSTAIYLLNYKYYERDLSTNACSIIIWSIVFLAIGEYFAIILRTGGVLRKKETRNNTEIANQSYLSISAKRCKFLILSSFIIAFIKLVILFHNARSMGFVGSLLSITQFMRGRIISGEYGYPAIIIYLSYYIDCVAYYFLFLFFYKAIVFKEYDKILLLIVPAYLIAAFASTGRTELISLFFYIFVCFFHIRHCVNRKKDRKNDRRINKFFFISIVLIVFLFGLFGNLRNEELGSLVDMVSSYYSASLFGLDEFISRNNASPVVWGEMVFSNVYKIIDMIFKTELYTVVGTNPFGAFYWKTSQGIFFSNIYTGLAIPLHDFGVSGLFVSRLLIGFLFGYIFGGNRFNTISIKNSIHIVMMCIVMICPLLSPVADRYYTFLSISPIRYLVFLILIRKYLKIQEKVERINGAEDVYDESYYSAKNYFRIGKQKG